MATHRAQRRVPPLRYRSPIRLAADLIVDLGSGDRSPRGAGPRHHAPPTRVPSDHRDLVRPRRPLLTSAPAPVPPQGVYAAVSATVLGASAAVVAVTGASVVAPAAEPVTQPLRLAAESAPAGPTTHPMTGPVQVDSAFGTPVPTWDRADVTQLTQALPASLQRTDATRLAAASRAATTSAVLTRPDRTADDAPPVAAAPARATTRPQAPHTAPAAAAPAASSTGAAALLAAMTQLGKPYRWGAAGPSAFDCSGLVLWAFKQVGMSLPHSSSALSTMGTAVSGDQLRPGDLVFFYSPVSHVGIYAGNGQVINATTSGQPVKLSDLSRMPFHNARRL